MGKPKKPEPLEDDIPSWLMTFSDVITLLMTFFILLMTFATSEPETFERMQKAIFGGGGGSEGIAGPSDGSLDKEAVLVRYRPKSSRLTTQGTTMPPIEDDPTYATLDKGVKNLDEDVDLTKENAIQVPLTLLLDDAQKPTDFGRRLLGMISRQAKSRKLEIRLSSALPENVAALVAVTDYLHIDERVPVGHVSMAEAVGQFERLVVTLRKL